MTLIRGFTAGWPEVTPRAHFGVKLALDAVSLLVDMPAPAGVDPELTRSLSRHLLEAAGQVRHTAPCLVSNWDPNRETSLLPAVELHLHTAVKPVSLRPCHTEHHQEPASPAEQLGE